MRIWVDVANSPHVLFFDPIVRDLRELGHEVDVTARDFAQTVPLAEKYGLNVTVVGCHGGGHRFLKVLNTLNRARQLRAFARGKRYDLAISHNSYAHAIASRSLRIRTATLMDYEYQPANHINFRLANLVLVPFTFSDKDLRRYGASPSRTCKYHGLKEHVYLDGFQPHPSFVESIRACFNEAGLIFSPDHVLIVIRPPATMAAYHRFDNPLFGRLLAHLGRDDSARILVFARTAAQAAEIRPCLGHNTVIANRNFEGRNLIFHADLVVSAGGTMNREAAVMGVPAYTIYAGRMGSVDKYLIRMGKMTAIAGPDDFRRIKIRKKAELSATLRFETRREIVRCILQFAESHRVANPVPSASF